MPMLDPASRESGIEFAVGCFLLALGIGLLIPRPGIGLYSLLRTDGFAEWWSISLLTTGLGLCLFSGQRRPRVRLAFVVAGMACWIALAIRFGEARLYGALIQSLMGVFLMNACAFRLFRYISRKNNV